MAIASIFLLFYSLTTLLSLSIAANTTSFHPKALVLPVTRDSLTNQYTTLLHQRTPLVPIKLTLDLSGQFLWVDCEHSYVSSTYRPAHCRSPQCTLTRSKFCRNCFPSKPGCNNNTCRLFPNNILTHTNNVGEVATDVIAIRSTNGFNPGKIVKVPKFLFTCAETNLLKGLARGVKGMAGLGRSDISLPALFSSAFGFPKKFAFCLSASNGVLFFGDGPYVFLPGLDVSQSLIYTPLIKNPDDSAGPIFHGRPAAEYFIGVKGIKINDKFIPINTSLLSIGAEGEGGTKISLVNRYTVVESSIYNAVVNAFAKALSGVPKVKPVRPFKLCFNATSLGSTRVGPGVPAIDFVLQGKDVIWRVFGSNSMVNVGNDALCLAFVDGGVEATTSIVIGGYQLEDNFLQFDLVNSRLGFTSSLLFRQTNCGNFNFTTST